MTGGAAEGVDGTGAPVTQEAVDGIRAAADGGVRAALDAEGAVRVDAPGYSLLVAADGLTARLTADGTDTLLQLPGALDRVDEPDESLAVDRPALDLSGPRPVVTVGRRSTAWAQAGTRIECGPHGPEIAWSVTGSGALGTVLLLATRAALGGRGGGLRPSGHDFRTLFSPNPGAPRRLTRGAGESAVIGVCGDARPGRGHWFFTPAPLCFALSPAAMADDIDPAGPAAPGTPGPWWTIGIGAPVAELTFTEAGWVPSDLGFQLRLEYEGHTRVEGDFRTPSVLISPGHRDPYAGIAAHRRWLADSGRLPASVTAPAERPAWWTEPMFCGWGAQTHRAAVTGRSAPDLSTRREYDAHLDHLERRGIVPGTVVIDDKWQRRYGHWQPDEDKWPALREWIDGRHARGQRILLWWRAWSVEGVPDELCVRTADGVPVTLDPGHPEARRLLAGAIARMLSPDGGGLNADGLKIDFTADTPSGRNLTSHGGSWGIALLHQQLAVIHRAAKEAKPDALVITHTPHPSFVDVTDMIRLNDMLRLDDPDPYAPVVPQMRHRAAVARAACPELPVDTDDWCVPDREQWREYLVSKGGFGVPALYCATHIDRTGEPLTDEDYAEVRRVWDRWRTASGGRGTGTGRMGPGRTGCGGREMRAGRAGWAE